MKTLLTFALSLLAFSGFSQPILRGVVTTNAQHSGTLVNGNALIWNTACGCWTNGSPSATATNAISTINGDGTAAQVIAVGSNSNDVKIANASGTTTINIPTADSTHTGKLSSNDWSINPNSTSSMPRLSQVSS